MSTLTKKRVRWYEENDGVVTHNEDVDVLTSADAVTFDDGETLQAKYSNGHLAKSSELGDLEGLSTTNNSNLVDSINEVNTNVTNIQGTIDELNKNTGFTLSSTLTAGQTTLTFSDARITDNSILASVYTSKFGVAIKNAEISSSSLTLTFKEQTEDITVKVVIK